MQKFTKQEVISRVRLTWLLSSLFWALILLAFSSYYTKNLNDRNAVIEQFLPIVQSVPELQTEVEHWKERARILNNAHDSCSADRRSSSERLQIYENNIRIYDHNYGKCLEANAELGWELYELKSGNSTGE